MEMYLAYSHPDTNLWWNLGWTGSDDDFSPMLSGPGQTIDPDDPSTFEIDPFYGDTTPAGIINVNKGYLFDPTGALSGGDGIPFSGDELMAPTAVSYTHLTLPTKRIV